MTKVPSGDTTRVIPFYAVDSTDFVTPETGLSGFTVQRQRNGGSLTAMTTPTVTEVSAANAPGVYNLLADEDTTLTAGNDTEIMIFHISVAGMAPVAREIELYRPKITEGETATVASGVIESAVQSIAASAITAASIATDAIGAAEIAADAIGSSELATSAVNEIRDAILSDSTAFQGADIAAILTDTGTTLPGEHATLATAASIAALNDLSAAEVNAEVDTAFTTQIADSVPADGTIPTREQSLLMITRFLWEKAVSGTTVTVTKEDGSTSNMTFTLDDGTNPTSITRAT